MSLPSPLRRSARRTAPHHRSRRLSFEACEDRLMMAVDPFEIDNTAASAKFIATDGTAQVHTFHRGTDVDWVKFTLDRTSNVTLYTGGVAGGDTELRLYGPNTTGRLIAYDNDGAPGGYSKIVRSGTQALGAGTYWVRVNELGMNHTISRYAIRVTASALEADLTAFRPQQGAGSYAPFAKTAVPEAVETDPRQGPGIRLNGDDDNANGLGDRFDAAVAGENDLIEVTLRGLGPGYYLERTSDNLRVWTSASKGTSSELVFSNNRTATLAFASAAASEQTVWVEWVGLGHGEAGLSLKPAFTSRWTLPQDSVLFHTFQSVVVALGGEDQVPSDPLDASHGMFQIATQLYGEGYDVHMHDEEDVDAAGAGVVYDEVVNAVQNRGVTQVAIFGYSHGGGSTFHLADRLSANRSAIGSFTIPYTAYVDGVADDYELQMSAETRRPPLSLWHDNFFQRGSFSDLWLDGGPILGNPGADYEVDVESTVWGAGATHFTVDDLPEVKTAIHDHLLARVVC